MICLWRIRRGWRSRAWRSHRIGSRYTDIRAREMLWPSLPTERRCWVWGISAREAALPVMEGKACLFKRFGGVDAYPICLNTKDPEEIVRAVQLIAPGFGGINLEDISAPRCFEIEERLIETLDIPVFHDDQHGTAVVVLAALINGAKCLGLELPQVQTVISGAGVCGHLHLQAADEGGCAGYHPLRPAGGHLGGPGGPERGQDGHGEGH